MPVKHFVLTKYNDNLRVDRIQGAIPHNLRVVGGQPERLRGARAKSTLAAGRRDLTQTNYLTAAPSGNNAYRTYTSLLFGVSGGTKGRRLPSVPCVVAPDWPPHTLVACFVKNSGGAKARAPAIVRGLTAETVWRMAMALVSPKALTGLWSFKSPRPGLPKAADYDLVCDHLREDQQTTQTEE